MRDENTAVPRSEFMAHVSECLADSTGFCADMRPLLKVGVAYDPVTAGAFVKETLIVRLPEPNERPASR